MNKQRLTLLFGSFNPIHIGHLLICQFLLRNGLTDLIWIVVTPKSPFKLKVNMPDAQVRLEWVRKSIPESLKDRIIPSDIELSIPAPNYTYLTLRAISSTIGNNYQISLLMGQDTYECLPLWRNREEIVEYPVYIYPRGCRKRILTLHKHHYPLTHAPVFDISSTQIRQRISLGESEILEIPHQILNHVVSYYRSHNFR